MARRDLCGETVEPNSGLTEDGAALRIDAASRQLRRALRPIDWVVLEDVALDTRPDVDGHLVAPTSARRVAEHLGLTPGAVALALSRLRSAGLVTYLRQTGPTGGFGLSAYVLGPVPGLDVIEAAGEPCGVPPRSESPHTESPRVVEPHMATAEMTGDPSEPITAPAQELDAKQGRRRRATRSAGAARRPSVAAPVVQLSILDPTDESLDTKSQ